MFRAWGRNGTSGLRGSCYRVEFRSTGIIVVATTLDPKPIVEVGVTEALYHYL